MATGDVKIKLILDGKEFEAELQKSKKSVKNFKKETEDSATKGGDSFVSMAKKAGLVATAISTAKTIFEGFTSTTQAQTDAWGREVARLTAVWDSFKASIFTDEMTSFADSMNLALERAAALYDVMDKLTNVQMSVAFSSALDTSAIKEQLTIARDKSRSPEERQAAINNARRITSTMGESSNIARETSMDAVRHMFAAKAGLPVNMVSIEDVERALRLDATLMAESERERVKTSAANYLTKIEEQKKQYSDPTIIFGLRPKKLGDNSDLRTMAIRSTQNKYKADLITNAAVNLMSDEELDAAMKAFISYTTAMNVYNEQVQALDALQTELNNSVAAASKNAKLAAEKRAAEAAELEAMRAEIYDAVEISGAPASGVSLLPSRKGWQDVFTERKKPRISGIEASLIMPKSVQALNIESPWEQDQLKQIEKLDEALQNTDMIVGSLSSSFSNLGSTIGGAAGNMLEFVGNTLECIQQMIPLIGYIQAEAIMRDQNASAAMKEAAAKTLSAYAGIPFAGVALGLAAVSSIVAVMSSLPKFAEGGIVTSATMGIFGEAGPEAVMPLDRLNEFVGAGRNNIRVQGEIVGRGKDLVVVIDNYNKTRRVR